MIAAGMPSRPAGADRHAEPRRPAAPAPHSSSRSEQVRLCLGDGAGKPSEVVQHFTFAGENSDVPTASVRGGRRRFEPAPVPAFEPPTKLGSSSRPPRSIPMEEVPWVPGSRAQTHALVTQVGRALAQPGAR